MCVGYAVDVRRALFCSCSIAADLMYAVVDWLGN